jgi:inhibitor of cysteine peptidase
VVTHFAETKRRARMKRVLWIALGLIIIAGIVGGSVAASGGESKNVAADASYSGKTIEISAGNSLTVTLDSNPSTGFSWVLKGIGNESVLEQAGHEFKAAPASDPPLLGAGGKEIWTFKALNKGSSTISMEYVRSWEQNVEPQDTFALTVVVK